MTPRFLPQGVSSPDPSSGIFDSRAVVVSSESRAPHEIHPRSQLTSLVHSSAVRRPPAALLPYRSRIKKICKESRIPGSYPYTINYSIIFELWDEQDTGFTILPILISSQAV
jgi:hypothetical protein